MSALTAALEDATKDQQGPIPAQLVREHLAQARSRGESFRSAWPLARDAALLGVHSMDHEEWSNALSATKPSFKRAYEGTQATAGDLAAARLEGDWP